MPIIACVNEPVKRLPVVSGKFDEKEMEGSVVCPKRLGGMLKHDHREAA
jgi:hypothetical protein